MRLAVFRAWNPFCTVLAYRTIRGSWDNGLSKDINEAQGEINGCPFKSDVERADVL